MSRKTQRYSKEFKAEAVRTVLENQLSISEGACRFNLSMQHPFQLSLSVF
ncbi:IS600 transposase [Escherichia coli]|nr:IS600 transposase [Escherichia coli]